MNLATDGSEDNLTHCFKESKPCKAGKEILKNQVLILTKNYLNPFEIDEIDVALIAPEILIVDSDHDEDEDIDIM